MLRRLRSRLRALWLWKRRESDLDDELAYHLSEDADEHVAAGLSTDDAKAAARKAFGSDLRVREDTREVWGWRAVERLVQDVRYGARSMRRHLSVTAVAVLTLALGIGATTAILNVVTALMLRSLPYPEADRVVMLFATSPKRDLFRDTTSFLDFTAWKTQSHAFTDAAAFRQDVFNITGDGVPESVTGLRASPELMGVLGVTPGIGRAVDGQEQKRQDAVTLISHRLWTERYGRDPRILNRTLLLNEVSYTVVGVLPPRFQFPAFSDVDVIVPVPERTCRSCGYVRGVARLKADVSLPAAQQELNAIASRREHEFPDSNQDRGVNIVRLQDEAVGSVRTPLLALLGSGFFVLLIGCANVGHLVLANGIARQRELAVRSALGAGRGRLVRQLLTESITLALVAAVVGSLFALWGSAFLVSSLSQQFRLPAMAANLSLLAWASGLAVLAGALSGLPPALMAWRSRSIDAMKQDSRSQSGGLTERRLGRLLLVGQTALTVTLLIGAGLLVKSFIKLQRVDLGVETHQALTADLLLSKRHADPGRREMYVRQLLDAIGAVPGVQVAAIHVDPPFLGGGRRETFRVDGYSDPAPDRGYSAAFNIVSGDFFRAMDLPVVRGRGFTADDTAGRDPVAVVNETMARQFWPNEHALGKRLQFYYEKDRERWLSIVGVVRDVRYRGRLAEVVPQVFVTGQQPFYKVTDGPSYLVVRTSGEPTRLLTAVQAAVWSVDRDQPIANLRTMDRVLWDAAAAPRVYMLLLGIFAIIALVIASAGIYGVSTYAVARRTHEMGIRLALGATPRQARALVLREGLLATLAGMGLGIAGALALTKVISRFLFGMTATDAPTFAAVVLCFVGVAWLSTYIPARRVAAIDPTQALRSE